MKKSLSVSWLTLSVGFSSFCLADENIQSHSDAIETISVTAQKIERPLLQTPAAISVVSTTDALLTQPKLQLDEVLDAVPGVYTQNRYNFAQNLRISIRGFGARAPFGVRGLQLHVDGIPFTLPDGQSQVDSINLDTMDQLEVLRGPASVQYGNGAGGVINIQSAYGHELSSPLALDLQIGNDDFYKTTATIAGSGSQGSYRVGLSQLKYRGYREQSQVEKRIVDGKFFWALDEDRSVTMITTLLDLPVAQDPGGLTLAQAEEDPKQATFMANRLDAGQNVDQVTWGLRYRDSGLSSGEWTASVFATRRNFFQQLPFPGSSQIHYDRWFYGGDVELTHSADLFGLPTVMNTGISLYQQEDDRLRYQVTSDAQVADKTADEMQTASSTGTYLQADFHLSDALILSAGMRYDVLKLDIEDDLGLSDVGSGDRRFEEVSGSLGLSYGISESSQLYASVSTGFESPTFTEFANPNGTGFNPDLDAQQAVNVELGFRSLSEDGLTYDVTAFQTNVKDELIPYQLNDLTYYENASETRRTGVEVASRWPINEYWTLQSTATLARYEFRQFDAQTGPSIRGNELPGLPSEQWHNKLRWQNGRWNIDLSASYTGDYYAENANATRIASVWLVDTATHWQASDSLAIYGGIRNLTNQDYYGNVRVNANSDRDLDNRGYFEPAPERVFYLGLQLAL